jgi:arylsulfatase A-like enzyme
VKFIEDHAAGADAHAGIGRKPFFLYLAYNAPHWPFQAPDKPEQVRTKGDWSIGTRASEYAAMVERIDRGVGEVLRILDQRGLAKNTLVVFSSDNGGERLSRNAPFFNRKGSLWEGGIRVPWILRWPGVLPSKSTYSEPMVTMDLTATVIAAAGASSPRALDGVDLLPLLTARAKPTPRTLFWRINRDERKQKAARSGRWKYLRDGAFDLLFDLQTDPSERVDVAHLHQEIVVELKQKLAAWEKEVDATRPAVVVQ